jgi:dihydropteroate synthase
MIDLPAGARAYLRPIQFVDTPVGRDGEVARLGGGLLWFAAYELIAVKDGRRVLQVAVPVADLPDQLRGLAERISAPRATLALGDRALRMDQPQVMGILNVTPDSFSDGEKYYGDPEGAAGAGVAMSGEGAALIDVGGESTRPGADALWEGDEIARIVPVVERLARSGTAVSIDTRKAPVMEAALKAGAHLVNDVAALLWDPRALDVVAKAGCPVVLMHSPEPAKGPHGGSGYGDVLIEVYDWLEARVAAVAAAGVDRAKILIDPGIGFGKSMVSRCSTGSAVPSCWARAASG